MARSRGSPTAPPSAPASCSTSPRASSPRSLAAFGDRLLFAGGGPSGSEAWISDGTAFGTRLLADPESPVPSDPSGFAETGSRLAFFEAGTTAAGREVWVTDGTSAGTVLAGDLWAGPENSRPTEFTLSGGRILFAASDPLLGREIWLRDLGATTKEVGSPCAVVGGPRLRADDPVLGAPWQLGGFRSPAGTAGFLWATVGWPLPIRLAPTCAAYVDVSSILLSSPVVVGGSWSSSLPLPNLATLVGLRLTLQASSGPTAGPLGFDVTNAVQAQFGG